MGTERDIFSWRRHWAHRLLPAPVLPVSRDEMDLLGWDACDVILVTGDAYVDHPSFGVALIGRLLEAQGFRVGVIAQPDWTAPDDFRALGRPRVMFGVTGGNLDSLVANKTADGRHRSDDAYSPDDQAGRRPDRAVIAYTGRCRQAFGDVPVIIGGIEASLRRAAHYDYWSDRVRRSILLDAKADLLLYGSAERAVVEVAHRLAQGEAVAEITGVAGTVLVQPAGFLHGEDRIEEIPSFEQVCTDPRAFCRAARMVHRHSRPGNAQSLVQDHGGRKVIHRPPPAPLTTGEMDRIYELPFTRMPHPSYAGARLKAWETVRFSITILRGCYGGCSFCSLACHEGPVIQSRSESSVLAEIERVRDTTPGFTGIITDLGGPTANMYRTGCGRDGGPAGCRRHSCLVPDVCRHLVTSHRPLIRLYRRARALPGIKKVLIGSGVRYDLALRSPTYVDELVQHHVGGYLKVAPEHVAAGPLRAMGKPGPAVFERFWRRFESISRQAGKEQYLIPYFIAAHPGTSDEDMLELALWLKQRGLHVDQVQTFLPSPMTLATAMYHTGLDLMHPGRLRPIQVPRGLQTRRLHKAFLRYHDANNWPLLRQALESMGRRDLIGGRKHQLVPGWQPRGTGARPEGARRKRRRKGPKRR